MLQLRWYERIKVYLEAKVFGSFGVLLVLAISLCVRARKYRVHIMLCLVLALSVINLQLATFPTKRTVRQSPVALQSGFWHQNGEYIRQINVRNKGKRLQQQL